MYPGAYDWEPRVFMIEKNKFLNHLKKDYGGHLTMEDINEMK